MLTSFPFSLFIGAILGILAGLGTGGGSLLILWLTLVCKMDSAIARCINLLFFIPSALTAITFRFRNQRPPWKKLIGPTIAGCIAAMISSYFFMQVNTPTLQKLFGILLIFIGIKEVCYKNKTGASA